MSIICLMFLVVASVMNVEMWYIGRLSFLYYVRGEMVEDGYLSGFMSFVFAWKLYDGNYILHQGCFPIDIYLENTTKIVSDGSPSPDGKRRMEMYVERPSVYYFFPSSARSIIESWYNAGIIKELCVFMPPVRTPDNKIGRASCRERV